MKMAKFKSKIWKSKKQMVDDNKLYEALHRLERAGLITKNVLTSMSDLASDELKKEVTEEFKDKQEEICGHLGCDGKLIHYDGKGFYSVMCEKCGYGRGGSK